MRNFALAVIILLALPVAWGASYYPSRLEDPQAVYLTTDKFPVHADGKADDTGAIQAAIDQVESAHGEGIVFIPQGRYRITRTIYVWPGVRIIGYGAKRPVFLLGDHTPGYQKDLGYMFFFAGGRPGSKHARWYGGNNNRPPTPGTVPPDHLVPDANPGTFYSAMSNVDFEIGEGNPAAVAIRFHVAQHCYLAHIDFHIGSGLAALKDIGNEAEDLHFYEGDYGIITGKPSPGWQFTLLDSTFERQRKAAIQEHEAALTLVHGLFRDLPEAISIDPGYSEELWVQNTRFENISGPAITVSNEKNPRTEINLENIACHNVKTFVRLRESGRSFPGPAENYEVKSFSHGLALSSQGSRDEIRTKFDAAAVAELPSLGKNIISSLPPTDMWINLRSLGAKGDGVTDDTQAIKKAIAEHQVLYIPTGRYVVSDTITLRPDTVLIGLHPSTTQFDLPEDAKGFQGPGAPRPMFETPKEGHNIVTGIGISTGGTNSRAVGMRWMAGADSLMIDVRFLGGHGTNAADGSRINPYNNTHTADPDPRKRWDGQYPSLWITDGGGGTFADIWTPSTFAQAGLYISNTSTPGRVYELSSEHHVRTEVKLDCVKNWELLALQTEEERGESAFAIPLEISRSENITIANYHGYRVVSSYQLITTAVKVSESRGIRFRNVKVDSDSKASFDNSVIDTTTRKEYRAREFATLDISGIPVTAESSSTVAVLAPEAKLEQLATGFFNISGATIDSEGRLYFVDAHKQHIYRWSPETKEAVVVQDSPLDPVNLAFDKSGNLLVVSYGGEGAVFTFRPDSPDNTVALLKPEESVARPGMTAVLPANVWDNRNLGEQKKWQYVSPDRSIFLPAGEDFVTGQLYYGTKMSDILRAFGLVKATPGHPFYITSESDEKTYRGNVSETGSFSDFQLFVEDGGESVAQDSAGNVYLAAGQVLVYGPEGQRIGQIEIPERPIELIFGGADRHTLYIFTHKSLYAIRMKNAGL